MKYQKKGTKMVLVAYNPGTLFFAVFLKVISLWLWREEIVTNVEYLIFS